MSKVASTFSHRRSSGGWVISTLAIISTIAVLAWPIPPREGLNMWLFSRQHYSVCEPLVAEWNRTHTPKVDLFLMERRALERRMFSAFLSDTQSADLFEVEVNSAARTFTGPLHEIGFVDLTDRLHAEAIFSQINEPSFAPSTSRGRIFGLPHDVHPVLLAYRADIVEAAGIDISRAATWEEFTSLLAPLIRDLDGDGAPDRYLLGLWETMPEQIEALMLQGGGRFFDDAGAPVLNSEENARSLARIVSWISGPDRIGADVPPFTASGNKLLLDGYVIAYLMPDWLAARWKRDLSPLAGKVKLMPLPAFEAGGRRTSVMGGTMLGIAADTPHFDAAWRFAKHLYLSRESARGLFQNTGVITPVKAFWDDPVFAEPDAFFSGQEIGRLFIEQAPHVPVRSSSPFRGFAQQKVAEAVIALKKHATSSSQYEPDQLEAQARVVLARAQERLKRQMHKNVFLRPR